MKGGARWEKACLLQRGKRRRGDDKLQGLKGYEGVVCEVRKEGNEQVN